MAGTSPEISPFKRSVWRYSWAATADTRWCKNWAAAAAADAVAAAAAAVAAAAVRQRQEHTWKQAWKQTCISTWISNTPQPPRCRDAGKGSVMTGLYPNGAPRLFHAVLAGTSQPCLALYLLAFLIPPISQENNDIGLTYFSGKNRVSVLTPIAARQGIVLAARGGWRYSQLCLCGNWVFRCLFSKPVIQL